MVSRVIAVCVLVLGFVLASLLQPSQAQQRGGQDGRTLVRAPALIFAPVSPDEAKAVSKELNLTPEQQKQMQEVNQRYNREVAALKGDYEKAVRDLLSLIQEPSPDAGVANQRVKEFHNVHQQIISKEIEYWREFKTILTPEQNNKFWTLFTRSRLGAGQAGPGRR